ncbi:signal transduction histidine kinase/CheY-like chemotaxis protein [Clostridium tetanomorphum]|uniref:Stage 0 sporulation protein A homolog n=1 Tax=Clostridium tetanomorphum TaxID=1553 RepID=A0A923EF50_CLOTT|nr:ATP-binding protein [Clostridium tetanomorphum]KAJ52871.1 sensor histidine kinase [Clostridium tetanomorphum DSM 665]MBC2400158.1 response regulator [Clostridium tetanomorphum]MBP1866542.1 signal transduction histidine kinase/CheY-like chemotaxis protein [Clostridium tetanomorphum]NRS86580.1 signal transduction histidine kinase/CheY-like chemotaxis protein [Clostridium tetanomorphum]NRZ95356.1 signal transduction histidine kinase/CheY-like chemotaxis protein [Clostridium tetanomorphum]
MDCTYKRLIEEKKVKKILCISTEFINANNFPVFIKEYISKELYKNEKVFIFTDDLLYKDLEEIFYSYSELIINSLNSGILKVQLYDPDNFGTNSEDLLQILKYTAKTKEKINIIWDFKNFARRSGKLKELSKCIENIFSYSNEKVRNIVYMNNYNYNIDLLEKICVRFDGMIISDRNKELYFDCNKDIKKILWILNSNAQLKYQNNNLVLFNDMFSNISKTSDKDAFKSIIMNKVKDICNVDFCIIYTTEKLEENILGLDSYFGITKKHKYYMMNERKLISYQRVLNKHIIAKGSSIFVDFNDLNDKSLKNRFNSLGLDSCIAIYVDYYENIKGSIWVGRYKNDKRISNEEKEYIESICKTAFYLTEEQNKFLDLQNKLIENEKLRAMGEMAAGIAHDINNILTPIIGSIQLLKDSNIEDKNIIKQLKIIEICAYDGMNIANKVKSFTKQYNVKNKLDIFNIDDIILDAIDLTKNKWLTESALNGISINMISKLNSDAMVKGNTTELREVFINIIRNAIDAMYNGGEIEIITENKDNMVNIQIRDNGIGMNEEVVRRAFEPFFTTKGNKGSGLGLSVSYKIIQDHGGIMNIESKENVGTCFYIGLPICNNVDKSKDNMYEEKIDFHGNILIIDDQQQIRSVVSDMVKSIVKCKIKSCGNDNIEEELKRRKYDIILCDFSMPGLNGLQVSQIVKKINEEAFFCLMTGWVGNFNSNATQNIDLILNKPINKEKLKEMFIIYKNMMKIY